MKLHTFGDSHAVHYGGWGDININGLEIIMNHLHGKLMYSFGRDKNLLFNNVSDGDMVCFCFGEIDCRCHINKYEPDWKSNIDNIVDNYFIAIKQNTINYKNLTVFVYNVVPPLERESEVNKKIEEFQIKYGVPALGTDQERKNYTEYMNSKLKEYSQKNNYVFFDVYERYVDENGFLNSELSDGNCHIKNPIYMIEFLNNFIKNKNK